METVTILVERAEWMDDAVCKGRTNLFFGIAGERPERRVRREETARRLCATCPVLVQCRDMARRSRENGFWGGENEEERAAAGYAPRSISRRAVQEAARAS
jgi:WhiB family redox-sensing transcriptional regulator